MDAELRDLPLREGAASTYTECYEVRKYEPLFKCVTDVRRIFKY